MKIDTTNTSAEAGVALSRNTAALSAHAVRLPVTAAINRVSNWSGRIERQRAAVLVGAGLLGGIALETVSPQRWSRVGAALFGTGAWLARSAIGPALVGALFSSVLTRSNESDVGKQGSESCGDDTNEGC